METPINERSARCAIRGRPDANGIGNGKSAAAKQIAPVIKNDFRGSHIGGRRNTQRPGVDRGVAGVTIIAVECQCATADLNQSPAPADGAVPGEILTIVVHQGCNGLAKDQIITQGESRRAGLKGAAVGDIHIARAQRPGIANL